MKRVLVVLCMVWCITNVAKASELNAVDLVNNLCGDTWCEGPTNYNFTSLVCINTTCQLSFTIMNCDDIEKEGTTGSVILKNTTMSDFYPTIDNELNEAIANKLFNIFD